MEVRCLCCLASLLHSRLFYLHEQLYCRSTAALQFE
jgi:hypothetical protein